MEERIGGKTKQEWTDAWHARLAAAGIKQPEPRRAKNYHGRGLGTVDLTPRYRKSTHAPWG